MFAVNKDTQLTEIIDALQRELGHVTDSDIKSKLVDQLVQLHTIKSANKRQKVSSDTLATIFANLTGILIIVKHEQMNVIASKALGFVQKLR